MKPRYGDWLIGDIKKFDVNSQKLCDVGLIFEKDFSTKLKETIDEMKIYLED